jgi:hypothetical protein
MLSAVIGVLIVTLVVVLLIGIAAGLIWGDRRD